MGQLVHAGRRETVVAADMLEQVALVSHHAVVVHRGVAHVDTHSVYPALGNNLR